MRKILFFSSYRLQLSYIDFLFVQVYKNNELFYYIDGYDESKSNWMRYVNPAYSSQAQNLIAYQHEVRPICTILSTVLFKKYINDVYVFSVYHFSRTYTFSQLELFLKTKNYWYGTAKSSQID